MPPSYQQVQYSSAFAGKYGACHLLASRDEPWQFLTTDNEINTKDSSTVMDDQEQTARMPCTFLQDGVSLLVLPMARQTRGWSDLHFHPQLRLPESQSQPQGMTILLEAMAKECVAVALSPEASFVLGKTYVVHFGAAGNVSTVIRRRLPRDPELLPEEGYNRHYHDFDSIETSFPSGVCSEESWISYWICWIASSCQVWVGVGKIPGRRCIGYLEDGSEGAASLPPMCFVGLGNSALGRQAAPLKYRNVVVTALPTFLFNVLQGLIHQDFPLVVMGGDENNDDAETKALMEEYQQECRKSKARAKKFGIPYTQPPPEAFAQWSKTRRLRANRGFVTGLDLMSPDEVAKQEARKRRFGGNDGENNNNNDVEPDNNATDDEEIEEATNDSQTPTIEAWDNENFVRGHRVDPPPQLWNIPSHFLVEPDDEQVAMVPEKIHIFTIDWAAFKQIRTNDIMTYFSEYGPSFVEWMGELSCNILFEDKYSAARALQHMSTELPTPPPAELEVGRSTDSDEAHEPPDLGNMGWRLCKKPVRKIADDRYGRRGTRARILMRLATTMDVLAERPTSQPLPPGFSTTRVLGPGSEFETGPKRKRLRPDGNETREGIEAEEVEESTGEPVLLSRALRSGRSGFTVEQMEAERQAARQEGPSQH